MVNVPKYVRCPICKEFGEITNPRFIKLYKKNPEEAITAFPHPVCDICKEHYILTEECLRNDKDEYKTSW
jgi:hypothetical protein